MTKMKEGSPEQVSSFYRSSYRRIPKGPEGQAQQSDTNMNDGDGLRSPSAREEAPEISAPTPNRRGRPMSRGYERELRSPTVRPPDFQYSEDEQSLNGVPPRQQRSPYGVANAPDNRLDNYDLTGDDESVGGPVRENSVHSSGLHLKGPNSHGFGFYSNGGSAGNITRRPFTMRNYAPFTPGSIDYETMEEEDAIDAEEIRQMNLEAGIDEDTGEALFVRSDMSETPGTDSSGISRRLSAAAGEFRAEDAGHVSDEPKYTETGVLIKKKKGVGRGRGRPVAGRILNGPIFTGAATHVKDQVNKISKNRSVPKHTRKWETNARITLVDSNSLSQANLIKRGINPGEVPEQISKKGKGTSDPENIWIVNMKDHEGLSFEEIAVRANEKRIAEGRVPCMKANAANCRYNRTAPTLYQMRGLKFISIADRANGSGDIVMNRQMQEMIWSSDMDTALTAIEKEYRCRKWKLIANRMAERFPEADWLSEKQVATRFNHL